MILLIRIFKYIGLVAATILTLALVTAVGMFITTRGSYTVPATVADDPTLPRVEINGITLHAETFGDPTNPIVVVVHGGPGGDYGYLLNLHQLEDEYFVVFYDQQGAGLSPRVPAEELTLQSSIDDLHRIVSHYGQGEAVRIVGHSWGAMLAAAYVGQHPDNVSHVILAEPGALDNAGLDRFRERQAASQGLGYYRLLIPTIFETFHMDETDADARMDYIYGKMTANFVNTAASGYRCTALEKAPSTSNVSVPPSRFGAVAFNTLFGPTADLTPIAANAANYKGHVLFLASQCNSFTGVEFQRMQMSLFRQAELVLIPEAGHEMFGDNPAASMANVRGFFDY